MPGIEDLRGPLYIDPESVETRDTPLTDFESDLRFVDKKKRTEMYYKMLELLHGMSDEEKKEYLHGGRLDQYFPSKERALEFTDDPVSEEFYETGEHFNQGGRIGYQTGGVTQEQKFQPDYIEALGKTYAADLTRQAGIPAITQATAQMPGETASQFQQRQAQAQQFDITQQSMGALAPQVAAQDPMQAAAYAQATDPTYGLGAYQPYTAAAQTAAGAATALTGTGAGAAGTAGTIASYMSPYQQDVIDTTMTEFDEQALRQKATQAANVLGTPGAYGGGREGVLQAQYQTGSDRNRAALHAQMLEQGWQQGQQARQQDFRQQQALATQQSGLGAQAMGNVQRQIAGLGTLGATQQVQNQAVLDAQRQFAGMALNEPQQRLGMLGQGVTGLMGGTQGMGTTLGQAPPQTSPLGTALGIGSTLAGIYGYMNR